MKFFTTSRYANVASTLALAVAFTGTGYAAASLPYGHHHANKPADKTAPTVVFQGGSTGHLVSQLHISPATKKPKVKRLSKGLYAITFSGFKFSSGADVGTCTESNYVDGAATVDGSGSATMLVHTFDQAGDPADAYFNCAVWNTDGK
jgi:hypothetical protein